MTNKQKALVCYCKVENILAAGSDLSVTITGAMRIYNVIPLLVNSYVILHYCYAYLQYTMVSSPNLSRTEL